MRAFKVFLNGKLLCLAGAGEDRVLSVIIDYVGNDNQRLHLHVGGLRIPEEEHVRWQNRDLVVGDEVRVKVVEAAKVDVPTKRFPRDPKWDERAKKHYVRNLAKELGWKIQPNRKRP